MYKPSDGAVAFFEFYSKDTLASKKFLENIFGWKMAKSEVGGVDIWTFEPGNGPEGHMMAPLGLAPGTAAFVKVRSVDAVTEKVPKFGGKILVPKFEVPGMGSFTYFEAPGGTVHAAYQPRKSGRRRH